MPDFTPKQNGLNVIIVDDTVTYRAILKETLSKVPFANVLDTAKHGKHALEKIEQHLHAGTKVDLVLLDVEMPIMDGMETLKALKKTHPNIAVVMVSGANSKSANLTFNALEAGALDFIPKPDGGNAHSNITALRDQLSPIIKLLYDGKLSTPKITLNNVAIKPASVEKVSTIPPRPGSAKPFNALKRIQNNLFRPKIIAIGISTGGPNALKSVIPKLSKNLGVPIVVVIHMPEKFTGYLAESLNRESAITVKEAHDGDTLMPDTVYIAPGGRHMEVAKQQTKAVIQLNDNPKENNCRPAVDVLFRSIPRAYSNGVLNIIMTGMGSDGLKGVIELQKHQGNMTLTQEEKSCTVYGMPKAIDDAGLTDESIELSQIADRLNELCHLNGVKGLVR